MIRGKTGQNRLSRRQECNHPIKRKSSSTSLPQCPTYVAFYFPNLFYLFLTLCRWGKATFRGKHFVDCRDCTTTVFCPGKLGFVRCLWRQSLRCFQHVYSLQFLRSSLDGKFQTSDETPWCKKCVVVSYGSGTKVDMHARGRDYRSKYASFGEPWCWRCQQCRYETDIVENESRWTLLEHIWRNSELKTLIPLESARFGQGWNENVYIRPKCSYVDWFSGNRWMKLYQLDVMQSRRK